MPAKIQLAWKLDPQTGCHNVTSHVPERCGYVRIKVHGKHVAVHRWVWEQAHGEIPQGMFICHRCDNRRCVNLAHLFLGTHDDNMRDKKEKGRNPKGEDNGRAKLTKQDVLYIREHLEINNCEMARQLGVTNALVSHIRLGNFWKHLL